MEKEPITPDFSQAKTDPFRVPEGYFESLTDRIMAALPERPTHQTPPTVPLVDKVKPLLYLAAAFLGMMLLFKGLSAFRPATKGAMRPLYVQHATATDAATEDEIDYLDYLESQYADRFFSDEIDAWE